ncbi:P-II family nitrogen regulator [Hydrogenovibrio sp. JE_KL2]|uniref:P-II family nitrogen regulator n=1 Tax=Hydrogenovibrio sp. JE_KL2 TaxID=2651188 RepID=UPI00128D1A34|nr:P-II family nitrogen regulator [Hydrogenovibrio sp. JE_KL2]MPQ76818.1 P-II family nitrogen regulator [Hydrogenovibrio sp. JE_KL2]
MKLVNAIINPYRLTDLREALSNLGDYGLTVTEVKGYGRQKGHKEIYRGAEYQISFVPKLSLELVIADDKLEEVVSCISDTVRTGKIGDGKIFISTVEQAIRIRTAEEDDTAL